MANVTETLSREHMDVVIVGHVDHGKSTVIGRLMADTGSLPDGKLDQVKAMCKANARPFEYAFLLDALKNEQAQGITIDTARCFFKTEKRNYIIHDAPGHIEFLKNMVTGAARAEAALLVIDALEGVQENSKRHGYMASMLGIKQISVLVNKMDLVNYEERIFEEIKEEYGKFLTCLGVNPISFIPISAREGVNIAAMGGDMAWYTGMTVLDQVDAFTKSTGHADLTFRMPVQDIYKFTAEDDDRRIVAGTVSTGCIKVGDPVIFMPSRKESQIKSIEAFNSPESSKSEAGYATGMTLTTQIYIKPGELMCKKDEPAPKVGRRFRANLFWMGRPPLIKNKQYKLRIGAAAVPVELAQIINILDASELSSDVTKQQADRHDVAECILETLRPVAFDLCNDIEPTGRFVIVDDFEIAGCGIILEQSDETQSVMEDHVREQEFAWEKGHITAEDRLKHFNNQGILVVLHGIYGCGKRRIAKELERTLFEEGYNSYYFGVSNYFKELDHDFEQLDKDMHTYGMAREQHLEKLGQMARVFTDSGTILITTIAEADDYDLEKLKLLDSANGIFVINVGKNVFVKYPLDVELPYRPDMDTAIQSIIDTMKDKGILL